MVLGHQHDVASRPQSCAALHPLVGIAFSGVKDVGIGGAVAPLAIEKSVGAEMDDDAKFEILPGNLLRRGLDIDGVDGLRIHAC